MVVCVCCWCSLRLCVCDVGVCYDCVCVCCCCFPCFILFHLVSSCFILFLFPFISQHSSSSLLLIPSFTHHPLSRANRERPRKSRWRRKGDPTRPRRPSSRLRRASRSAETVFFTPPLMVCFFLNIFFNRITCIVSSLTYTHNRYTSLIPIFLPFFFSSLFPPFNPFSPGDDHRAQLSKCEPRYQDTRSFVPSPQP